MLDETTLIERLARAMRDAVIELPRDVTDSIRSARERETGEVARGQLDAILRNIELASGKKVPLCQDTGVQTFFIRAGYDFPHLSLLHRILPEAIRQATATVPLRPNTVDPFTGKNPGNNLGHNMPAVTIDLVEGEDAEVYIFPKGGGSENMSALWMLTPAEGIKGMKRRVLTHIREAGGKPCPPVVLGIGIGGGADMALKLGKKALLRPVGSANPDPFLDEMERELLADINRLGVGPMGLGGDTTALAVHIGHTARHPATFPVGLVVQCWCDRRASIRITKNGEVL